MDNETDWLGFNDPDERKAAAGPAFIVAPKVGQRELVVMEEMGRRGSADFLGSTEIVFTTVDPETGAEIWEQPQAPDFVAEGERWQRIMSWPTVPTIADAEAFVINARRALLAAWWDRLAAARVEDDAERPATPSRSPKGDADGPQK